MSPKWLSHSKTDEIKHKVLYIAEYEGVSGADFAIRTFQSEKRIEWNYVDNENGIKNKTNVLEGPAAFIQTTTKPLLHDENETRLLFIDLDETSDQTELILREAAKECAYGGHFGSSLSMENWHEHILGLQPLRVIIPFAQDLAAHFPNERIRSRRDFPKLLSLIKVSAFLHQKRRDRDDEELIASPLDYQITKPLFEHCYGMGPDNNISELMEVAQRQNKPFKVSELLAGTGWRKSKAYEVLNRAVDLGLIADGERRATYEFIRMPAACPLHLPDSVELP